jgi:hypothetical protein
LKPKRLADTAYGTGDFLGWVVGRGIAPHIPVRDASERDDGTFSHSDFRWDRRHGVSICPNNKVLHTTGPCTMATCSATAPPNSTAMLLQDAMLSEWLPDRYPVMFTKMPATWRDGEWGQSASQIAR